MPQNIENLEGMKFGALRIKGRAEDYTYTRAAGKRKGKLEKRVVWKCICVCGNQINVVAYDLKRCTARSCGCIKNEIGKNVMKRIPELFYEEKCKVMERL